ncbi:MAG: prolipoprotein diacylglyceryl transferase [Pelotomaculum sp. PtaU1.Bin035]|nr:MAG: prolipoprotein diacylglyceryl transferase [Pelotomaculum sp. PtaU1.Bin035]
MDRYPIIDFGNFPIYNIMGGLGFIAGLLLFMKNLNGIDEPEREKDKILTLLAVSFLSAMFFANFINWFVIPGVLNYSLIDRFRVAGFTFYFGLIAFFFTSYVLLKIYKFQVGKIINFVIPSALIFHSFGRIGCSFGGCCYGKEINYNLFNHFLIERFPAREIEAFLLFVLFVTAYFFIKKDRLVFYLYTYPVIRFFLEYGRGDVRGKLFTDILSPAQMVSIFIVVLTTIVLVIKK